MLELDRSGTRISLVTLSVLDRACIDNIIFLSIVSARLPESQQALARRIGLGLALLARILLLFSLTWLIGLTRPIFEIAGFEVSWRDIVLAGGGLFLLVKGTMEMHHMLEGYGGESAAGTASFAAVIAQIVMLDVVFSLDSVITAVGIAEHIPSWSARSSPHGGHAAAAEPTARFVAPPHGQDAGVVVPAARGVALIARRLRHHIPQLSVRDRVLVGVRSLDHGARAYGAAPPAPGLSCGA
jgi:hypothetical protein